MVVASGQLPYEYEWPTPFRVSSSPQGMSGIHLEAAQFVIQAEIRKFAAHFETLFNAPWRVHVNEATLPGSGYDPKANGATLGGFVGPPAVQVDLDHIALMRFLIAESLFDQYYPTIIQYDQVEILEDWIRQCYPESPSGYHPGQGPNPQFRGQFLRPVMQEDGSEYTPALVGASLTGMFIETDPHWLGGSGLILDIDVGEVMWNPYPMAFLDFSTDFHGTISDWSLNISPFWPRFQKTDGSLISVNGFENKWPQDRPGWSTSTVFSGFDHIASGKLSFKTYCIFPTTKLYMGALNTIYANKHVIGASPNEFTPIAPGGNPLGVHSSELFVDTVALPTGLYRVAARNRKIDKPFTTVESGVVSQWPKDDVFLTHRSGYEVFDNALWITDWAGRTIGSAHSPTGPSGLALLSPFTGGRLWQRNATDDVGGQVWDLSSSSLKDVRWWWNPSSTGTKPYLSLNRIDTNQIMRLVGATEAGAAPGGVFDASIAVYNDLISSVTNEPFTLSLPDDTSAVPATAIAVILASMTYDGTNLYITGDLSARESRTWVVDPVSFTEVDRHLGRPAGRIGYVSDGLGGTKSFVGFSNNDIRRYDLIANTSPANPDDTEALVFDEVSSKELQPPTGFTTTVAHIYALLEVEGVPELTDGVYALFSMRTVLTSGHLMFCRIYEDTTTWEVAQVITTLVSLGPNYNPGDSSLMGIVLMPIN